MLTTVRVRCTCAHEYQDEKYGRGIRVANPKKPETVKNNQKYRCTVCRREFGVLEVLK